MDITSIFNSSASAGTVGPELTGLFFVFVKTLYVIAAILYVLFSIVMVRQVRIMGDTLTTSLSPVLRLLAIAHLIAALVVLFLFVTTL